MKKTLKEIEKLRNEIEGLTHGVSELEEVNKYNEANELQKEIKNLENKINILKKYKINGLALKLIESKLICYIQNKENISERNMISFESNFYLEPFFLDIENEEISTRSLYLREALEDKKFKKEVLRLAFL